MNTIKQTPKKLLVSLIILTIVLFFSACSKDNNPTTPDTGVKNSDIKVLVLKDGGTEDSVYNILSKAGFDVTVGDYYYNFDGKFVSNYNLVILLNGVDYNNDIFDSTQTKLRNYVRDGGILLTTEWMTWSIANSTRYQILRDYLPAVYNGSYSYGTETYTKMVDNTITEGLPTTFSITDSTWNYSSTTLYNNSLCTNLKVLFSGDKSGAALTMGDLNKGKTIHWNMAGAYGNNSIWTPEVKKILINIAKYSGM